MRTQLRTADLEPLFRAIGVLVAVWNRGWRHWEQGSLRRITSESEALVVKIRWTLRP